MIRAIIALLMLQHTFLFSEEHGGVTEKPRRPRTEAKQEETVGEEVDPALAQALMDLYRKMEEATREPVVLEQRHYHSTGEIR